MQVKEIQIVTLALPKEAHLLVEFQNDKNWKEIGCGTVGATFEKVVKDIFIETKENIDGKTL